MTHKRRTSWKLPDIIDLEYFFHQDRQVPQEALAQRDREIYTRKIQDASPHETSGRLPHERLIRQWLAVLQQNHHATNPEGVLPGKAYADILRWVKLVLTGFGFFTGILLSWAFLQYSGKSPINVAYYLGGLVLPQLLMVVFMVLVLIRNLILPSRMPRSWIYHWIARLFASIMKKAVRPFLQAGKTDAQQDFTAVLDLVKLKNRIYGRLFFWPVFILVQIYGLAVNTGILAGTLVRVLGTDLAFGWQTTLNAAPETVWILVRGLALPWRWAMPSSLAHPGMEQILGSRIILKEGIDALATADLTAWWPFLCFCIFFYGILPRALFLAWGIFSRKRLLSGLSFLHADCQSLVLRMTTPIVSSAGCMTDPVSAAASFVTPEPEIFQDSGITDTPDAPGCVALIPEDLFGQVDAAVLVRHFPKIRACRNLNCLEVSLDMDLDRKPISSAVSDGYCGRGIAFVLVEAWQPPIRETLIFLKQLREILPDRTLLMLGMVGKPDKSGLFTHAGKADTDVWKRKLATLKDPYLLMEDPVAA